LSLQLTKSSEQMNWWGMIRSRRNVKSVCTFSLPTSQQVSLPYHNQLSMICQLHKKMYNNRVTLCQKYRAKITQKFWQIFNYYLWQELSQRQRSHLHYSMMQIWSHIQILRHQIRCNRKDWRRKIGDIYQLFLQSKSYHHQIEGKHTWLTEAF
jgi:hypothetical protein